MKMMGLILTTVALGVGGTLAMAQSKPEDTEVWKPTPAVVVAAREIGGPPSDALVLFDGDDLDQWVSTRDKSPAGWTISDGLLTVNKARGNIETKRAFRDYQLHLEWRVPGGLTGGGEGGGPGGWAGARQ